MRSVMRFGMSSASTSSCKYCRSRNPKRGPFEYTKRPVVLPGSTPNTTYCLDILLFRPSFPGRPARRERQRQQLVVVHDRVHRGDGVGHVLIGDVRDRFVVHGEYEVIAEPGRVEF